MSKEPKEIKKKNNDKEITNKERKSVDRPKEYLLSMSLAPRLDESIHWFQMLPAAFFTAVVIIITRMHAYERPMDQFYWSGGDNTLTDFFSYFKMAAILTCAILALVLLLYRIFTQSFFIKRNFAYIPMVVYTFFVLLSYGFSNYKLFALWGWNDRFEGTVTLIAYMVMLFYIINSVNTEKNVKWIIYPTAAFSALLGLLGLTQAFDHDFFRTAIGKKLITPSWFWDQVDTLNFTFQNKEIYQTVYNINYVSFYLTLLIPLFGMIFIHSVMKGKSEAIWKKLLWGALFTLLVFNLVGSVSSGGYLGMLVILVLGALVLNKRILQWKKPVIILFALAALMCFANFDQLQKEFNSAKGFFGTNKEASIPGYPQEKSSTASMKSKSHIDYIDTDTNQIKVSVEGNEMIITTFADDPLSVIVEDSDGKKVPTELIDAGSYLHQFTDERFRMCKMRPATDDDGNSYYLIYIDDSEWAFRLTEEGPLFANRMGALVDLNPVEQIGFENNPNFGSGRGFIWGTSIPMMKDTVLIGHGADTYCIYYPHNNYVGKYNAGWDDMNLIVDKPHCMYLGIAINTGIVSLLALIALWGIYIVQSVRLYFRKNFESDFITFTGSGIFFGICGFLAAALVNDSSVSVTPLFYGLLGTGIAINMILKKRVHGVDTE